MELDVGSGGAEAVWQTGMAKHVKSSKIERSFEPQEEKS